MTIRTWGQLRDEARGHPWCGPSAVAMMTGRTYGEVEEDLRRVMSIRATPYEKRRKALQQARLSTTWWHDLLTTARDLGAPTEPAFSSGNPDGRLPRVLASATLAGLVTRHLAPGWYLVRVTNHFVLLRVAGLRQAWLYDNVSTAVPSGTRAFGGRKRVSHVVRITGGPLVDAAP
jgi:hypothetical protein